MVILSATPFEDSYRSVLAGRAEKAKLATENTTMTTTDHYEPQLDAAEYNETTNESCLPRPLSPEECLEFWWFWYDDIIKTCEKHFMDLDGDLDGSIYLDSDTYYPIAANCVVVLEVTTGPPQSDSRIHAIPVRDLLANVRVMFDKGLLSMLTLDDGATTVRIVPVGALQPEAWEKILKGGHPHFMR